MSKVRAWLLVGGGAIVIAAGLVSVWRWLGEDPTPGVDALRRLGCKDASASHRSIDGKEKGPNDPVIVTCFVEGGTPPTCDAVCAAYRDAVKPTLDVLVNVRTPRGAVCMQNYAASCATSSASP